jgi:FkbM family methyltransferase
MSHNISKDFWVCFGQHSEPTFVKDAGDGQSDIRSQAYKFINSWRGCVDAGANAGMWTRFMMGDFEKIYAFEPNPVFIECFKRNIDLSKNVQLFEYGLSNQTHTATNNFNSTVLSKEPGSIKCRTLDSFNLSEIDFIKVDVDGFEDVLIEGAVETIQRNWPVINIEMKRAKRLSVCKKAESILKDLGYSMQQRTKRDEIWLKS